MSGAEAPQHSGGGGSAALWSSAWLCFLEIWLSQMFCNDNVTAFKSQMVGKEQPGSISFAEGLSRLQLDASGAYKSAELGLRRNGPGEIQM